MIRFALFGGLVLALGATASADDKKDVTKDQKPFQGMWKVVEASRDGKAAPKLPDLLFKFEGDKLHVTESKNEADTGSYSVDASKTPAEIDMTGKKGEKALGIYKFEKDGKLTLYMTRGKEPVRPKSFDDKGVVKMVLEKAKE